MERVFRGALMAGLVSWMAISLASPSIAIGVAKRAECAGRDAVMLEKQEKEAERFIKKHKEFVDHLDTLAKDEPQKLCKWISEAVITTMNRRVRQLEARMADTECGFDPLMQRILDAHLRERISWARLADSACSGVRDN